jgi:serine/threonine-protein kinase
MNEPVDPNRTVDVPSVPPGNEPRGPAGTVDVPSSPADALDAGLAAGFAAPRSSLPEMRPVLLKEVDGDSAHVVKPSSDAMPAKEETGDRYQLQGEIARGGMGAVLRGRDVDLGRDLAVKVLLEKHANRPEVVRRFLEEAQIGGQLQHPGVVPVYDIGRFGDRPFFTMKLVKGHTLAALLAERADPSADRPRFLAIVLQVCQALAYAHAKGVIHRDLKPANVMVGAFGEVQVMDWGLAKVLAEGGVADEERASRQQREEGTLIRTARSSGSAGTLGTDTEAGSLLGTPAYMPPEQAIGAVALLDRRADVFGLGAILCEVLTGKPPYVGRSSEEVRRKAANGDLADAMARLDACGADAELIVLTKRCLAPEAMDRPSDAGAVAEGLTAYQGGVQERLHRAELAEAEARARAMEEAKRRRLTLALAATVLLALALGGGGFLYVKSERDARQALVARDVNDALNLATVLREKAKSATSGGAALFAQAREQVSRARALVEAGPADVALAAQVRQLQAELDEEEKDRQLIAALDEARLAEAETVVGENRFASERAVPKFEAAFRDYGLGVGEVEPGAAVQRIRGRPAAAREALVAALDEWDRLAALPRVEISAPHRAWLRAVLAGAEPEDGLGRQVRALWAEKDPAKRQAALEQLAASANVDRVPASILTRLAERLGRKPAAELLRRAQRRYPADFWVNQTLGMALQLQAQPELAEAVRYLTAAVALRPNSPGAHFNLGNALNEKGDADGAITCFRKAIALDAKYAAAHNNLGTVLRARGQVEEAIPFYKKAIALDPKYAYAHCNLGNVLYKKGQVEEAIACWRKATLLDPKLASAHHHLGLALADKGRLNEALASLRRASALDPKHGMGPNDLGLRLAHKGQLDEAIACFREAIERDPKNAMAHMNLGTSLGRKGQVDEAIACFRQAIALDPKFALAHANLGNALRDRGKVEEAIACWRKATLLDPKDPAPHYNLGTALHLEGQVDRALVCYRKAITLDPKHAAAHNDLGRALIEKGQLDEAIACFRKATLLDPKPSPAYTNLGKALLGKGKVEEAIACHRKAIALDPKYIAAHFDLGNALAAKGQVGDAIACFRQAIALDPKFAMAHTNLGSALYFRGQAEEAIACWRKAVELNPKSAVAHTNLGMALFGKSQVDEAILCYQKALALDPRNAVIHCYLGHALSRQGRFAEALASLKRGHELGSKRPGWGFPSAQWVRQAERLAAMEAKLPVFRKGEYRPGDNKERLALAVVCRARKLHLAATDLYVAAFAADPKLVQDPRAGYRYDGACCAALAAVGKGEDAKLEDRERARLRKLVLDWLRADLALWAIQLQTGNPVGRTAVRQALLRWQRASDLAGLREALALAKLVAEEQEAFAQLWSAVAALLKKAEGKP